MEFRASGPHGSIRGTPAKKLRGSGRPENHWRRGNRCGVKTHRRRCQVKFRRDRGSNRDKRARRGAWERGETTTRLWEAWGVAEQRGYGGAGGVCAAELRERGGLRVWAAMGWVMGRRGSRRCDLRKGPGSWASVPLGTRASITAEISALLARRGRRWGMTGGAWLAVRATGRAVAGPARAVLLGRAGRCGERAAQAEGCGRAGVEWRRKWATAG